MTIYLRNSCPGGQNSHHFPAGIACAQEPWTEATGGLRFQPRLTGEKLAPVLVEIIAGDDNVGVQPVLPDDIRGEQQVLPRVKGLLLGVDPFRGNTHGHQLTGGAAALRHRLIAVVPSAGGDADRVGMGGQVLVGGFIEPLNIQK